MSPKRTVKFIAVLTMLGFVPGAFAASFDCGKAASATEKLICSDARTSVLDNQLQQTYRTALAATDASGKKALAKEQRHWITYIRGLCQDSACLQKAYGDRIAMLAHNEKTIVNEESYCAKPSGYQGSAKDCGVRVQAYRDANDHNDSFNKSLAGQKQGGRIVACHRLVDLSDGTHIGPGRGEQTFGGYCVLQNASKQEDVAICNDDMVGDFQVKPVSFQDMSDRHLIDFTYHCSGN